MKPVPGICDRCGLRYRLSDLQEEFLLGRPTGIYTCPQCYDESHPQLDTRSIKTDDKESVDHSKSDVAELDACRRLWAWNPVGCELTSTCVMWVGRVTVIEQG